MNGANPIPHAARDRTTLARLKLTQALQRAQYAIAWERVWPNLARLLTLAGLFLALSWAGLWLALPTPARAFGLALFAAAASAAVIPLARFRWPTREDGAWPPRPRHRHPPSPGNRTDRQGLHAGPCRAALWKAQRERTLASLSRIRAGLPSPRLALHDPGRCARWSWC